jgi:glycosyl transferase family 25
MNFIDKIYYINLDKRTDRKELLEKEFDKMQIPKDKIERFAAINNTIAGIIGCNQSHLEILNLALLNNYENVLILEDDFEFLISREKFYNLLNKFFEKYKDDYEICYLQYNLINFEEKDELIGLAKKSYTSAGYLINKRIIKDFRDKLEIDTKKLIETGEHWNYAIDVSWHTFQYNRNVYYFKERVGKQRASYSDLGKEYVDRGF